MTFPVVAQRNPRPDGQAPQVWPDISADDRTRLQTNQANPSAEHAMPGSTSPRSLALRHDGQTYAFGASWLVFGRPRQRDIREVLREMSATHWLSIKEGSTVQIAAYDLPGERGKIFSATQAVHARFGGDFVGLFELSGESFKSVYWLVAICEEIILCDSLHKTLEDAKKAHAKLQTPERTFCVTQLPEGFVSGTGGETAAVEDFLDLSEITLRRRVGKPWPVLLAAGFGLAILGAAQFIGFSHVPAPSPSVPEAPAPQKIMPSLMRVPLKAFVFSCEHAVAESVFRVSKGWLLTEANCLPGQAVLHFVSAESADLEPGIENAVSTQFNRLAGTADVSIPLEVKSEPIQEFSTTSDLIEFRARLRLIDREYLLEGEQEALPSRLYETHRFAFSTANPTPIWLAALSDADGIALSSVGFTSPDLHWHFEGRIHVVPE